MGAAHQGVDLVVGGILGAAGRRGRAGAGLGRTAVRSSWSRDSARPITTKPGVGAPGFVRTLRRGRGRGRENPDVLSSLAESHPAGKRFFAGAGGVCPDGARSPEERRGGNQQRRPGQRRPGQRRPGLHRRARAGERPSLRSGRGMRRHSWTVGGRGWRCSKSEECLKTRQGPGRQSGALSEPITRGRGARNGL